MISNVFIAYVVIALASVPSLTANAMVLGEPAVNATLSPITPGAGHSATPSEKPPATNSTSNPSDHTQEGATNTTNAGHPPTAAPSPTNAGNTTTATRATNITTNAGHPPTAAPNSTNAGNTTAATNANSTTAAHEPNSANATHGDSISKSPSSNTTGSNNEREGHAKATPAQKHSSHSEPELPMIPSCYSKKKSHGVETHHCEKALEKVVYAANQTLDKSSSLIFANYKTCNINLYKPKNATLTKIQVESLVRNITEGCHSVGGTLFKTSKIVAKVERGTAENTYEVGTSICRKEQCPLTQGDCLSAFHQIPLDHKGNLASKNGTLSFSRVTSGNCTVTISTTDHSNFAISRESVYPTMRKLFNECGRHPGKIYIPGGSVGLNGDLKLSTRASNHDLCE